MGFAKLCQLLRWGGVVIVYSTEVFADKGDDTAPVQNRTLGVSMNTKVGDCCWMS
jgi:hypothetical protein